PRPGPEHHREQLRWDAELRLYRLPRRAPAPAAARRHNRQTPQELQATPPARPPPHRAGTPPNPNPQRGHRAGNGVDPPVPVSVSLVFPTKWSGRVGLTDRFFEGRSFTRIRNDSGRLGLFASTTGRDTKGRETTPKWATGGKREWVWGA